MSTPAWWLDGLTATLMRESVSKHRAKEIAIGYWEAYCEAAAEQVAAAQEKVPPKEPPPELLMSMALRYDHGLCAPGYYDQLTGQKGEHEKRLRSTLATMRKLYEEVSGHGFYRPERHEYYAGLLPPDVAGRWVSVNDYPVALDPEIKGIGSITNAQED